MPSKEFLQNVTDLKKHEYESAQAPCEIVKRARDAALKCVAEYNILFKNCEHFATWCATGKTTSGQVLSFLKNIAIVCWSAILFIFAASVVLLIVFSYIAHLVATAPVALFLLVAGFVALLFYNSASKSQESFLEVSKCT